MHLKAESTHQIVADVLLDTTGPVSDAVDAHPQSEVHKRAAAFCNPEEYGKKPGYVLSYGAGSGCWMSRMFYSLRKTVQEGILHEGPYTFGVTLIN